MVSLLLLVLIYLAFISLGLPDSMFGAAWPVMRTTFAADTGMAGVVTMIVSCGTVVSSLSANRMMRRFGTGKIVLVSTAMTAAALVGYAAAPSLWVLCLAAVPLGLGAGCIDASLNNYVAVHYEARHMSWLHCMWGVGVTVSPLIAGLFLGSGQWRGGFVTVSIIQFALVALLASGLPLWKRVAARDGVGGNDKGEMIGNLQALSIPGVKWVLGVFFCYCAAEAMAGLWGATYLTDVKNLSAAAAATGVALYFGGLTGGRFLNGFLTMKFSSARLILAGQLVTLAGVAATILLPGLASAGGLALIGLGFAPVYPCTIHETPTRFGRAASQAVTGLQMAFAYIGVTAMPTLFGAVSRYVGMGFMPWVVGGFTVGMIACGVVVNRRVAR